MTDPREPGGEGDRLITLIGGPYHYRPWWVRDDPPPAATLEIWDRQIIYDLDDLGGVEYEHFVTHIYRRKRNDAARKYYFVGTEIKD